jgi:hypothetical protein
MESATTLPKALPKAVTTLPKSDSTTSLSSLISIGNESKNSGPSLPTCIICLGDEGPIRSTLKERTCTCSYHYHPACLKEWYDKHSSLCPVCRQENFLYRHTLPTLVTVLNRWQTALFIVGLVCFSGVLIWSIVKNR